MPAAKSYSPGTCLSLPEYSANFGTDFVYCCPSARAWVRLMDFNSSVMDDKPGAIPGGRAYYFAANGHTGSDSLVKYLDWSDLATVPSYFIGVTIAVAAIKVVNYD